MDAQGGDNIDVIIGFFELLAEDQQRRKIGDERHYFVSDPGLRTFKKFQGIRAGLVFPGTRIQQAALIWRQTPRALMGSLLAANGFVLPPDLIQIGSCTVLRA
jgi:hypothetical protein